MGEGHGKAVDWWSLGTLMYEMFVGRPPFQNQNKMQLLYTIATRKVDFSPVQKAGASPSLYNLLRKLMHPDPLKRLGGSDADADDIKNHPFFKDVDWEACHSKLLEVPFKPNVKN
jgi:serine/threonine protein kinase